MIFTYVCMCSIYKYVWYKHTYIRRSLHQFTSPPSHPAEFYFVSFVCWQSNGNNQQQEQKLNLPPLSASTHTHTRTHSCLCVRCCPLNQLCGSSALLGSFFLSLSLFLFALLLLLLQSKKLLMYPVSSPFSVSFPLLLCILDLSFHFLLQTTKRILSMCVCVCVSVHLCAYWFNNAHDW